MHKKTDSLLRNTLFFLTLLVTLVVHSPATVAHAEDFSIRDNFSNGILDGDPLEWRYMNFDGEGSMSEEPGYLTIEEHDSGVVGSRPYRYQTDEGLTTILPGRNWSMRTKFETKQGSYWSVGIGMMPGYNIASISEEGFFKLHRFANIFDSVQLPVESIIDRDVWLQVDLISDAEFSTMVATAWLADNPEDFYQLEHTYERFTDLRLPYLALLDAVALFDEATVTNTPPSTFFVADCNLDGEVNSDDLSCISSTIDRDHTLRELNLPIGDLDGDGSVSFPDFLILSANFGNASGNYSDGNLDLEDGISFPDFLILSDAFGTSTAVTAVPEPNCIGLFAILVVSLCRNIASRPRPICIRRLT